MQTNSFAIALCAVVGALCAWAVVGYIAWESSTLENNRTSLVDAHEQSMARATANARTHALLQDTVVERDSLFKESQVDILTVVNAIENVGSIAKINIQVRGAQPGIPIETRPGMPPLRPIEFLVQGDGSFTAIMRAVALLETLPFPTDVVQVDLGRGSLDDTTKAVPVWHLNATVKLLTTSDISS